MIFRNVQKWCVFGHIWILDGSKMYQIMIGSRSDSYWIVSVTDVNMDPEQIQKLMVSRNV